MAMEYVPGGILKDRVLGEGVLDPDAASTIASQIGCSAIYQPQTSSAA